MSDVFAKIALITGANSGIGRSIAVHFASKGCNLALTGLNAAKLVETKQLCIKAGLKENQMFAEAGDLTDGTVVTKLVYAVIAKFTRIDILVNNHGVGSAPGKGFQEFGENCLKSFDFINNVNVRSSLSLVKQCLPHLENAKGNIVFTSSISSIKGMATSMFYAMSKAAIDNLVHSLAVGLGPRGIRVNSVNPGLIDTGFLRQMGMSEDAKETVFDNADDVYPLRRTGEPIDVAKAVAFLASSDASFITGHNLFVDGGYSRLTPE